MPNKAKKFRDTLRNWADTNVRPMPWKGIRNPYFIWLSEVILQQTRVEQGRAYYERFIATWPTVTDLANAPEDDVLKCWEGLGYYSRARNLHAAAKHITTHFGGVFPTDYADIRALKGIGDYTAAAIASFAYDLPYSVLDGNVYRVLSRWYGLDTPIDSTEGKQLFARIAQEILDIAQPGRHNQAMMDFGATWCTPRNPRCGECPFQTMCKAHLDGTVDLLPVKSKKTAKKERFFLYFVFKQGGQTFLRKRIQKDIWQNLYEFPCVEPAELPTDVNGALELLPLSLEERATVRPVQLSSVYKQTLTHRLVAAVFLELECSGTVPAILDGCIASPAPPLPPAVALPRIVEWYWKG
jgi:A/G-specific adenine glycosylase